MTQDNHLMITVDDVGLSRSINQGTQKAIADGYVSNVSLMPCGPFSDSAVEFIQDYDIPVAVHLTLTRQSPVLEPSRIPSITTKGGTFPDTVFRLALRWFSGLVDKHDVYEEWKAQVESCLEPNLRPLSLNSHQHVHHFPGLFRIVLRLCEEFNIPHVRTADETSPPGTWERPTLPVFFLKYLAKMHRRRLGGRPEITRNDSYTGVIGSEDPSTMFDLVPKGLTEWGLHLCEPTVTDGSRLPNRKIFERKFKYTSSNVEEILNENRIRLISFNSSKTRERLL